MTTRILYADPGVAEPLASLRYEELGQVDNGVWVACPDETVRAIAELFAPRFLYFDWHDYELAVRGLTGPKVQEVIRRRRDRWSPESLAHAPQRLMDLESAWLESLLRVEMWEIRAAGGIAVDRSLAVLQRLAGLERYSIVPVNAMAVTIIEGESRLIALLNSALASGLFQGTEEGTVLARHGERRLEWAESIGQAAAALGSPAFRGGRAYADAARAIYLRPGRRFPGEIAVATGRAVGPGARRTDVRLGGASLFGTSAEWRHGAGCLRGSRRILRQHGIADRSAAAARHSDTLAAFAGGLAAGALRPNRPVHLHQLLLKMALSNRPDAQAACSAADFPAVLTEEIALLGRSLSSSSSFSARVGMEPGEEQAGAAVEADNALFASLAERYAPSVAGPLREVQLLRRGGGMP